MNALASPHKILNWRKNIVSQHVGPNALRVAASTYLNSAPLVWSFIHGSRQHQVSFVDAVPARCAALLANDEVEAALVPVIEYQRIPDLLVVPDVCVGSKQEVRSVVLVSRKDDLNEIHSVALDESSRTSATLVKIIFGEFIGHQPSWSTYSPDLSRMLGENDAALIIGDPGMTFGREGLRLWDMATLWHDYTGLGFVFAMWMCRRNAAEPIREVDFAGARDEGIARLEEIVDQYERSLGLSRAEIRSYLEDNISFHVENEMLVGLQRYFELAHKHNLIDSLKPLEFTGP
jgi:chorismate dehydratase